MIELVVGDRLTDRRRRGRRRPRRSSGARCDRQGTVAGRVAGDAPAAAAQRRAEPCALRRDGARPARTRGRRRAVRPARLPHRDAGRAGRAPSARRRADFSDEDERLLTSFATSAASAVVTARSVGGEQLRAREAATEDERRRWARELHDETLQGLGALRLSLSAARRATDPDVWRAALDDAIAELDTEIANVRGIISDVRPAALDELGVGGGGRGAGRPLPQPRDRRRAARRPRLRGRPRDDAARRRAGDGALPDRAGGDDERAQALRRRVAGRRRSPRRTVTSTIRVRDDGQGFDPSEHSGGFGLLGHARARRAARRTADDRLGARCGHHGHGAAARAPPRGRGRRRARRLASTTARPNRSASSKRT